ncbi:ABC transporter substrate-binding protein [Paenibacillus xanthanilyticus]|uniref:ABC transporter substrate-binding protein n=1 Tax=Paenibacillus xanthanilyticus TaxID=1783531 RepID=A0ABV8K5K7_9BACL
MQRQRTRSLRYVSVIIAAAVLSAAVWLWAGGREHSPPAKTEEGTMSAGAVPEQAQTDKLIMMFPAGSTPRDLPLVQAAINERLKPLIDATVELRPVDMGGWWDKTNLMFAKNEQIDLLFTAGWMRFGDEAAKGRFLPLSDLLRGYGEAITATLDPSIVEAGQINGQIYGIAVNKEFAASKGVVMRKDLVEKYDIDLSGVRQLSDLTPILLTIKENEPGMVPLQAGADRSPFTFMMQYGLFDMLGDGPGVLDRESRVTQVVNMVETPQFETYAKLMHAWNKAGFFNLDAAVSKDYEFEAVKAGSAFAYAESFKPGFDNQASRDTGMPMVTVTLTKPYTTTADTTSAMFAIPRTSKHPEKAMRLLNLLYADRELLNLLDWGIEGKHYVMKGEGIIDYPPGVDAKTTGYNLNQPWIFGNQMHSYLWANENPLLWEEYKAFNAQAEPSLALGFVFNPDPVKTEIAACGNVDQMFAPAINSGAVDPAIVLPMYKEKLKAAGADVVIREKQRQLDAWVRSRTDGGAR